MLFVLCLFMSTVLSAANSSFSLEQYCTVIENEVKSADPFDFKKYCTLEQEIQSVITAIRKLQFPNQWHCEICDQYFDKNCKQEKHKTSKIHKNHYMALIKKTDVSMDKLDCKIKRLKPLIIPE